MTTTTTTTRHPIPLETASQFASELDCMRRRLSHWLVTLQPDLIEMDIQKIRKALDDVGRLNIAFDSRFLRSQTTPMASPFSSDATRATGERLADILSSAAANAGTNGDASQQQK